MKRNKNRQAGAARTKFLIISLGIVVVLLGGSVIASAFHKGPIRVFGDTFIKSLLAQNGQSTYDLLTDNLKNQVGSEANWQSELNSSFANQTTHAQFKSMTPVANPSPTYPQGSNPEKLTYKVTFEGGKAYTMYLIVLTEGASLKVDEFNSILQ